MKDTGFAVEIEIIDNKVFIKNNLINEKRRIYDN